MPRSRRRVWILGLLSVAPIAVVVLLVPLMIVRILLGEDSGAAFATMVALGAAAAVTAYVMAVLYAIDAFRSPHVSEDMRAAWLVLLILLNAWVVPVYWYRHVRPTAVPA
jgi:hypothetical protein